VIYHNSVTLGGSTEHFTTNDGGAYLPNAYTKYSASDNAVREFKNPCSNHDNIGLIIWEKAHDRKQWSTKQTMKM